MLVVQGMTTQVTDPKAFFLGLMKKASELILDASDLEQLRRNGNFQRFHERIEKDLDKNAMELEAEIRSFLAWIDSVTQKEAGEGFLGG